MDISIREFRTSPAIGPYQPVDIQTNRGTIACRYYAVPGTRAAAIWVGGAGGGWDSPAAGLYDELCATLIQDSVASLRIQYRHANHLEECALDVLAGTAFLEHAGINAIGLTGHSFGGAVVVNAAAASPVVQTVITLSTQTYGIDPIRELSDYCSVLLVHGKADHVLPPRCSEYAYQIAHQPKQLVLYEGADHGLDAVRSELVPLIRRWITEHLPADSADSTDSPDEASNANNVGV